MLFDTPAPLKICQVVLEPPADHVHDQARSALSGRDHVVKSKNTRLLNRREFSGLCVALSSFVISPGASALDAATDVASTGAGRTVRFRDGTVVPALGQGSAGLGKGRHPQADEDEALRTGLSLGMTLIDTAEIYGSEEFIGRVIARQRNRVFRSPRCGLTMWRETASRGLVRRASLASGLITSISICCIGQTGLLISITS